MSSHSSSHSANKRPRGLLATRKRSRPEPPSTAESDLFLSSDDDDDDEDFFTYRKRARCSETPPSDAEETEYYYDYARKQVKPRVVPLDHAQMTTTSTAAKGKTVPAATVTYTDWQRLQLLFAEAAEENDRENNRGALPLLRAVIHECHRFLLVHEDPSILFCTPTAIDATQPWNVDHAEVVSDAQEPELVMPHELPTSFHALFGTTLFLFGNLISQDPSMTLAPEPESPIPYWMAALDVFETGEISPYNLSRLTDDNREDWGMSITWGRCLVCVADEMITRSLDGEDSIFNYVEPKWPKDSPFATIANCRPPVTRRMSLFCQTPNDLMTIAMDFFCRGIFHMPHASHRPAFGSATNSPTTPILFSRATELYKIAGEVLAVSERMETVSERTYWAAWADSVFNQMKMEADMDKWRGRITRARGRCWLVIGCAHLESLEDALEEGNDAVLMTPEAEESRTALGSAIEFFDRAKGSATSEFEPPDSQSLRSMLAEALVNLANLTPDEIKREELYARAQVEDGANFDLDAPMDTSD